MNDYFCAMQITEIEILEITITEPFTWLTNWCVAGFCFYFGHKLYHGLGKSKQRLYWSFFFLFMGVASMTGGTAHGFSNYVGVTFHYAAWIFTGIAVFLAQFATLGIIRDSRYFPVLKFLITVELLIMVSAVVFYQSFEAVRINSALGLLGLVLPLQLYGYKKLELQGHRVIVLGILSLSGPAIIHAGKFSYNRWLNFNDLSHLVMIGCFYLMYLGVTKLSSKEFNSEKATA